MKSTVLIFAMALLGSTFMSFEAQAASKATMALFNQMVKPYYNRALKCSPLETDPATSLNVTDWDNFKPVTPNFNKLIHLKSVSAEAKIYAASKVGTDKVQHCYAGCFVAKKLDYNSGAMLGWLKELKDSSDCDSKTHFELGDYLATKAGAIIGATDLTCESFCGSTEVQSLNGTEMIDLARRTVHN